MGLEEIEASIRGQGRKQIADLKDKASEEMKQIKRQFDGETDKECKKTSLEFEKKSESLRKGILNEARTRASNLIAVEKSRLVEQVLREAEEKVRKMPEEAKRKMLSKMLEGLDIGEKCTLLVESQCAALIPKSAKFEVKRQELGDFGFVLSSRDGLITVDRRLDSLMQEISEKNRHEVSEILFKER